VARPDFYGCVLRWLPDRQHGFVELEPDHRQALLPIAVVRRDWGQDAIGPGTEIACDIEFEARHKLRVTSRCGLLADRPQPGTRYDL
jgi:hypothetical protein